MVGVTYQDYLKYKQFLKKADPEREEREQEQKVMKIFLERFEERLGELEQTEKTIKNNESYLQEEGETYNIVVDDSADTEEEDNTHKRHDKLFRDLLNDKREFINFMKGFVDDKFNLKEADIELYNRDYITKGYKIRQSDVVYKVKEENVFFLIEHQSTVDYTMPIRIMEYCYETIRSVTENKKEKSKNYEIAKVIPIVLYTGNKKWQVPYQLEEKFFESFEEVGIKLKYLTVDINNYSKEQLLESNSIVGYSMRLERVNSNKEAIEALGKMLEGKTSEEDLSLVKRVIHYALKYKVTKEDLEEIDKIIEERKVVEAMVTIVERLEKNEQKIRKEAIEQGVEQGFAQGIAQGITQGIAQIVKKMIDSGMELKDIQKVTGLSEKEIKKLTKISKN